MFGRLRHHCQPRFFLSRRIGGLCSIQFLGSPFLVSLTRQRRFRYILYRAVLFLRTLSSTVQTSKSFRSSLTDSLYVTVQVPVCTCELYVARWKIAVHERGKNTRRHRSWASLLVLVPVLLVARSLPSMSAFATRDFLTTGEPSFM